ncbi:MAG: hypothetical protein C4B57_05275 [Deltaproteobacteria bacterium]|nr:MAG: hypothetical protein C4B57_05275 [Deltaproteobacteria bacterium]
MEKQASIDRLNRDLADEHVAIIRYLVHGYMEGEDTPYGCEPGFHLQGGDVAFSLARDDHIQIILELH